MVSLYVFEVRQRFVSDICAYVQCCFLFYRVQICIKARCDSACFCLGVFNLEHCNGVYFSACFPAFCRAIIKGSVVFGAFCVSLSNFYGWSPLLAMYSGISGVVPGIDMSCIHFRVDGMDEMFLTSFSIRVVELRRHVGYWFASADRDRNPFVCTYLAHFLCAHSQKCVAYVRKVTF